MMIDAQTELCESSDSVHTWGVKYFTPHGDVQTQAELAARKDTRKQAMREKNVVGRLDDVSCGE